MTIQSGFVDCRHERPVTALVSCMGIQSGRQNHHFASACEGGVIRLWSIFLATECIAELTGHGREVLTLMVLNYRGRPHLASGGTDETIKVRGTVQQG